MNPPTTIEISNKVKKKKMASNNEMWMVNRYTLPWTMRHQSLGVLCSATSFKILEKS
ncbi:hypothetical protein Hanom_Chr14g01309291 [Helianthus anomalus]